MTREAAVEFILKGENLWVECSRCEEGVAPPDPGAVPALPGICWACEGRGKVASLSHHKARVRLGQAVPQYFNPADYPPLENDGQIVITEYA